MMTLFSCELGIAVFSVLVLISAGSDLDDDFLCRNRMNLGLIQTSLSPQLQQDIKSLDCINVTFLDINDIPNLQNYYKAMSNQELNLMYIYTQQCHQLALIAISLAALMGGPEIALATPSVTCPPIDGRGNIFDFGPDWSKTANVISDVVKNEEADRVILIYGSQEFPYKETLQKMLSTQGVTLATYTVDPKSPHFGLSFVEDVCDISCRTTNNSGKITFDSTVVTVAVFDDAISLSYLVEKINSLSVPNLLWLLPVISPDWLSDCIILNPNVYLVVPTSKTLQSPEATLFHVLDTVIDHMNSSMNFYDLIDTQPILHDLNLGNNCSTGQLTKPEERKSLLYKVLQQYFPYANHDGQTKEASTAFVLMHYVTPTTHELEIKSSTNTQAKSQTQISYQDHNTSMVLKESATWNISNNLTVPDRDRLYIFVKDHQAPGTFIVGTVEAPSFTIKKNDSWTGFSIDLTNEVMQRLGMRYKIVESFDGQFGGVDANGSWGGLVRMAQLKEIDIAVGPITLTQERSTVVEFLQPIMEDGGGIIVKKVEDPIDKLFSNLRPFRPQVWLALFAVVAVVSLTFAIVNHWSPFRTAGKGYENLVTQCIHRAKDSVWIVLSSYMEQGASRFPFNTSGRLILGCWWLFAILISASYTAELAASLTWSIAREPIATLADLAEQTEIKPIAKQGTTWYSLIQSGETEIFRKLWELMKDAPKVTSAQEGLDLVRKGGYALITDYSQLGAYRKTDCANLVLGEEVFYKSGLGFFVPQGSPWREEINEIIVMLHEAGIVEKYKRKWWSMQCPNTERQIVQSLGLDSSGAQFIIMTCVMLLAVVTVCVERVWLKVKCKKGLETEGEINSTVQGETLNPPDDVLYKELRDSKSGVKIDANKNNDWVEESLLYDKEWISDPNLNQKNALYNGDKRINHTSKKVKKRNLSSSKNKSWKMAATDKDTGEVNCAFQYSDEG